MLFNRDKIILDLCAGSGAWSKYYKNAGYDVRIITLPDHDVTDYIPPNNVWGILAAPPCTHFSLARTTAKLPRNFIEGMIPVNACVRIAVISKPKFFALENPVGLLSKFLGKWQYDFQPWWFGDPYTKRTALWGWFNKPKRKYNDIKDIMTQEQIEQCKINNRPLPSIRDIKHTSDKRSITPAGFAKAFFEANP